MENKICHQIALYKPLSSFQVCCWRAEMIHLLDDVSVLLSFLCHANSFVWPSSFCPCFLQALFVSFSSFIRKNNVLMESYARHCSKSLTQVVCFIWKRMDLPFCTSCFNSHGPGMVSACAQGRDLTYGNEEFSLRKGITLTSTIPMWWTSVFLQPLPWRSNFWCQSPLGSKSFPLAAPCLHPAGPAAAVPETCVASYRAPPSPASDKLGCLRQEIPVNQGFAITEMSLSNFMRLCICQSVGGKLECVPQPAPSLAAWEGLPEELSWLISALWGVSLWGAPQGFKRCQCLKGQEDAQSSTRYSAETAMGTKIAISAFRS